MARTAIGSPAYAGETFTDTSFGFTTTRNFNSSIFHSIEMDMWGDNSGAALRLAFLSIDSSKGFYSDVTVNFSGLRHVKIPITSFVTFGGATSNDWTQIKYFQIQDNIGTKLFNINIDSVVANPILTGIRDWSLYY